MNLICFSTLAPHTALGKMCKTAERLAFSGFFKAAFLKFQWRKVADFSII